MSDADTNGSRPAPGETNIEAVLDRFNRRLRTIEERLEDVEAAVDGGRTHNIQQVLEHAQRVAHGDTAVLKYDEVMAAAGVSAPTAYSYIDELVENNDAVWREDREDGVKRIAVDVTAFNPPKTGP